MSSNKKNRLERMSMLQPPSAHGSPPAAPGPASPTVLIIDDTPVNLEFIAEALALHGFRVMIAQDGAEGIQRAEFAQPDLILLDVMMPELSGVDVCRQLKAHPGTQHIPVIIMTALSEVEDKLAGFAAGGVDYVIKPLQIDEVVARVDIHLRLHTLQKQLSAQNGELNRYREQLEQGVAERTAELTESNRRLRESEQRYQDIFHNISDAVFLLEVDSGTEGPRFRLLDFNPVFEESWSRSREELAGKYIDELLSQSVLDQVLLHYKRCAETGVAVEFQGVAERPGQGQRELQITVLPVRDESGRIHRLTGVARDVTASRRYETLRHEREQEFRRLVENSPDTIARYDQDCRRLYANPKLLAMMGGDPARVLGLTPAQAPGGAHGARYETLIREVFAHRAERDMEIRWRTASGDEMCTHLRLSPEFNLAGEVEQVLAVGRDITEFDAYRRKVHQQAYFDSLTGLPNRSLLSERLQQEMAEAARNGSRFSLMLLDLDNFKEINDTVGHSAGDLLLREMAGRLKTSVRECDTVARLGGDEFALLLPDTEGDDDAGAIAVRILRALAEPFLLDGREFVVTCSIGIVRYPADSTDTDNLYKYADSAMYHAKKLGRNTFHFYAPELTRHVTERLELEAALRRARRNGELELYYQPQVDMPSGRVVGAEALLRWHRPGHGLVGPDRFIAAAEASGLIVDIGEWVLHSACRAAAAWNRGRATPLHIAVNLSTRQFHRNDLAGSVFRILGETGCRPQWLKLEITESLLLDDSDEVVNALQSLNHAGLTISIDDFGTGYSALSYLNRFPVSQLKIDRSFVHNIPFRRDKSELVKAMLSISTALHLEAVAEGVESQVQAEYLMAHGCRLAQGYLYGKPMPVDEFEAIVTA